MQEQQSGMVDPQLALAALTAALKVSSDIGVKDLTQYGSNGGKPPYDPTYSLNFQQAKPELGIETGTGDKLVDAFQSKVGPDFDMKRRLGLFSSDAREHPGMTYSRNENDERRFRIAYSPGSDYGAFAHELGHVLAQSGTFGARVNDLRHAVDKMPALQNAFDTAAKTLPDSVSKSLKPYLNARSAMQGARMVLPGAIAAAIPGDDDVALSLAAGLALASPKLLDEAIATNRGLAIMKEAGLKATPRQRARLAGAWGSYLAQPMVGALIGNVAGNLGE